MKRTLLILAVTASASPADALTLLDGTRSVEATFTNAAGQELANDFDGEIILEDESYSEFLSAVIGGSGFSASIGMGPSGFFGIDAEIFVAGTLETTVRSLETYENNTAFPVDLAASFLIVEGELQLFAATGGTLTLDVETGTLSSPEFRGQGQLTSVDFVSTYAETGRSIGGVQAFPGGIVDLPFTRTVIDLGRLEPGERFRYFYELTIVSDADLLEFARWEFLDPTNVAGQASPFLLTATPAGPTAAVPVPAPLGLLAMAMAMLFGARRRREGR